MRKELDVFLLLKWKKLENGSNFNLIGKPEIGKQMDMIRNMTSRRHNLITYWTRQQLKGEISQKELENRIRPLFANQLELKIPKKGEENER